MLSKYFDGELCYSEKYDSATPATSNQVRGEIKSPKCDGGSKLSKCPVASEDLSTYLALLKHFGLGTHCTIGVFFKTLNASAMAVLAFGASFPNSGTASAFLGRYF
jgi:hypothetical protein